MMTLLDVDELLTTWRYRHSLMVHRMLGKKLGTGGSSGFSYLKAAATRHRVFDDLFDLSSYLVPRHTMPDLPPSIIAKMRFSFDEGGR
tara:strand:+ start:823 stop:1086 length:264 start_codon:yes stop_codon:yes gene_type:complete